MPTQSITISCEHCGKSFPCKPSRAARTKYCSRVCMFASKGVHRVCDHCGVSFKVPPSIIKRGENHGRFCSAACRYAHQFGGMVDCACKQCGKSFRVMASQKDIGHGIYCSMACRAASFRGAGNPSWTGGKKNTGGGYIEIKTHDGRRIREHRYVMEQHIGRRLLTTEHVHHINHNRRDNRIENLQLLTTNEHAQLHGNERRRNPKGQYD